MPDRAAELDELLHLSGAWAEAQQNGALMPEILEAQLRRSPPARRETLRRIMPSVMSQVFDAELFYAQLKSNMLPSYDAKRGGEMLNILRSPLSVKMEKLSEESATPENRREFARFFINPKLYEPAPKRLQHFIELERVSGTTDFLAQTMEMMAAAILSVARHGRPGPDGTEAEAEQVKRAFRPVLYKMVIMSEVYAYRDVTDEELAAYVKVSKSDPSRWFRQLYRAAYQKTFVARTRAAALKIEALRSDGAR